jgi:TolB protein
MKPDRFDYTVWAVLAALMLAIAGVVWAGDRAGARVKGTFPAAGAPVGAYSSIGVEFAQAMQVKTVEALFQIEPAISGTMRWEGQMLWFAPAQPFQRGVTYTARLAAGALSLGGQSVKQDVVWEFTVRDPWVVYLSPINQGREVWRARPDGADAQQLTHTGGNVYDLAVARDGEQIAYSALNEQRGIDLWLMNADGSNARRAVDCGLDQCSVPAFSPDGAQIAYSRESAGLAPGAPPGPPRAWILNLTTGETGPLYQDSQVLGYGPSWSPTGEQIAVLDGGVGSLRVYNILNGQEALLPTAMGMMGTWSPDGGQMIYTDLTFGGDAPYTTLYRADFADINIAPLLGQEPNSADYGPPAWSPTGEWLAISQRTADGGPGKQIWLMRPDGSDARPVTADGKYTHGGYRWDAWGQALVFQRFEMNVAFAAPEVAVWDMPTGQQTVIARDATLPTWAP